MLRNKMRVSPCPVEGLSNWMPGCLDGREILGATMLRVCCLRFLFLTIGILATGVLASACEEDECSDSSGEWCEGNRLMYCHKRPFPYDQPNIIKEQIDCETDGRVCVENSDNTAMCVEPEDVSDSNTPLSEEQR